MWETQFESPTIQVTSDVFDLEPGEGFVSAIKRFAREAGYSKVRVFIVKNGVQTEVDIDNAPATVEEGMEIKITPYEKAA